MNLYLNIVLLSRVAFIQEFVSFSSEHSKSLESKYTALNCARIFEVARSRFNRLGLFFNNISDQVLIDALSGRKNFNRVAALQEEFQNRLQFDAHTNRQQAASESNQKIEKIATVLFEAELITDEVILSEDIKAIENLYSTACCILKQNQLRACGKSQFLSSVLQVLMKIESSYRIVDKKDFYAKTKAHVTSCILQAMNRISPYIKK